MTLRRLAAFAGRFLPYPTSSSSASLSMAISSCAEAVEVVAIGAEGGSGVAVGLVNTTESIVRREAVLFDDRR